MSLRSSKPRNGIHFNEEGDLVTAVDEETGATGSGKSRGLALVALGEVLHLQEGGGERITDVEAFDREMGFDPDEMDSTSPPWLG